MKYLLDTHTWLWFVKGVELSPSVQRTIDTACDRGDAFLSPISIWEIALKASRGQLVLPEPSRKWLLDAVSTSNVTLAPFDLYVAAACAELPITFHGDPADRILAATCRVQELTLLTRDYRLLSLAAQGVLSAERI